MQAQGREISFNMEDYRHAEYASAAPKTTFTGTGQKLGRLVLTKFVFFSFFLYQNI